MHPPPFDPDRIDPLDPDLFDETRAGRAGWRYLTVRPSGQPGDELLEQIARVLEECAEECEHGWSLDESRRVPLVLGIKDSRASVVAERIAWLEEELLALDAGLEIEDGAP